MTLHDSNAHVLTGDGDLSPSLPDPATVPGRTHDLTNTNSAPVVWTSTGATPFQVDGVNVASLTVPRGGSSRVQSDGVRWVMVRPVGSRPGFAATAVSNASGDAVVTFPAGLFPAAPVVAVSIQLADSANPVDYRVTTLSSSSVTVRCRQSPTLTVLSLSVLGISQPLAGVTVHVIATQAGTTA